MFFTSIKGSWHVEDEGRDGYDDDNESAITKGMFAYYLDSSGHENDEKKDEEFAYNEHSEKAAGWVYW